MDREAVAAGPAREQLRLVAGEREQAAAVGRGRVARTELVGDREAPGRRLGARAPDGDRERADRAAVAAQRQPPRGAVDVDRPVGARRAARGAPGSSPACRWAARSPARRSQPPRRAVTESTRGESNSVRRADPVQRAAAGRGAQLRRCEHPRGQVAAGGGGGGAAAACATSWTGRERAAAQAPTPRRSRRASPRRAGEPRASPHRGYPVAASSGRSLRRGASSPMRLSTSSASAR